MEDRAKISREALRPLKEKQLTLRAQMKQVQSGINDQKYQLVDLKKDLNETIKAKSDLEARIANENKKLTENHRYHLI